MAATGSQNIPHVPNAQLSQESGLQKTSKPACSELDECQDPAISLAEGDNEKQDAQCLTVQNEEDENGQASKDETHTNAARTDSRFDEKPFSVFTHNERRIIVLCAGFTALFSPIASQIYFPALNEIAHDLDVSYDLINLTITTYLIMQGLAPTFIGSFSDDAGRRPAYLACIIIFFAANLGLALQSNYAALLVLRCIQSAGSSGTVALANAVAADIVSSQERGTYIAYLSVAPQVGPTLGPVIGGLLAQYLGWHAIFWFLLILTGVIFVVDFFFFPETCRKIVDDGSVPPPVWLRSWMNTKIEKRLTREGIEVQYDKRSELAQARRFRFPNPLASVKIIFTREAGYVLAYIAFVVTAFYAVTALIPSQFGRIYGFNEIQIALCYLPLGAGCATAAFVRGRIIDSRFRFHAKRLGYALQHNRGMDLSDFPIERARIEVAVPTIALGSAATIGLGWMLQYEVNLAGPLIFFFLIGFCISASINSINVLLVDLFPGKAGSAVAANNLTRCWLGAGGTAGVVPLINKVGIGWTTTFFGLLPIVFSPLLWYIMINGPSWRKATKERKDREKEARNQPNPV